MNIKKTVQNIFIFALLILFLVACIAMVHPFFTILLWTIFLYIIFRPVHELCVKKLNPEKRMYKFKKNLLAGVFSIGILILIITPVIFIGFLLVQEFISFTQQALQFLKDNPNLFTADGPLSSFYLFIDKIGLNIPNLEIPDIHSYLMQLLQAYSSKVLSIGTSIVSKTGNFVISLLFVVFALYFCFLDGQYLGSVVKQALPVKPSYMKVLTEKFTTITKNLFSGYILVALYQGVVSFIIMLIFGVKGSLLFSVLLMFCSFIPIVGASIVWLPIGISLCFTTTPLKGILFIVICGFCVSLLDNFLRPFLLKDRINVHPLIIFFAILGGLKVFGMNGLILGPLTVILFFTVLNMLLNTKDDNSQIPLSDNSASADNNESEEED
ncbi:MAG: AI-2E family transporter [Treponema sp.]|uniref:AI-2E family transporter n=1 Tax=Treponema sp. TaxID=166 RepID=UPI00298DA7F3|nr:AI-2E family transporter [Treponema sp.]MDD5810605.1 AI-2E family transporter [Treponema sp.]